MQRRRSALPLTAAAALLAGVPLLTGCGSDAHPGAAAVVDGERITVSQVQARAEAVREAQRADPDSARLISSTGPLPRYTLNAMLLEEVVEEAAREQGVEVTRRDVQEWRAEQETRMGGREGLEAAMLREQAVPPQEVDTALRTDLLVRRVAEALGVQNDPGAGQVLNRAFTEAAKRLGIDVSPRFGTWNDEQLSLVGQTPPWLKQAETPQEPA
ncbi:SurA N-terminal domain-containing protein [Streptomyces sp. TRM 70351]|uniref:SurA N-terminal domain-containing protein n=1 Tax=Streptomyces sp. TRM 70351 TaxID=3116552 RepID=UPI002E7B9C02|nr:SurA N-terminal domain-containing protein [Streptomyces sp. TRM 70351]MEE1929417.1 SurA N-terminal domain-containing protein [Streptomyces sp. TRM 70351]